MLLLQLLVLLLVRDVLVVHLLRHVVHLMVDACFTVNIATQYCLMLIVLHSLILFCVLIGQLIVLGWHGHFRLLYLHGAISTLINDLLIVLVDVHVLLFLLVLLLLVCRHCLL